MLDAVLTPTRSWLFTPATRPDRFAKAAASGADVAILDLEDAVAPGDKDQARDTALRYLKSRGLEGARHALRINGLDSARVFVTSSRYSIPGRRPTTSFCPRSRPPVICRSSTAC